MNNLLNNLKNMNTFASISSNKGNSNIGSKSSKKTRNIIIIAFSIIIVIVVAIIIHIYIKNYSGNKIQSYNEETLLDNIYNCDNNPKIIEPSKIPSSSIGNEYSLNFWIYVKDMDHFYKNPNNLGNVMMRGLDNGNFGEQYYYEGNPGIFMDTGKNNLVFCFKPEMEKSDTPVTSDLQDLRDELANTKVAQLQSKNNEKNDYEARIVQLEKNIDELRMQKAEEYTQEGLNQVSIENIPLQRWTCINVSVFNQTVDIYVDGRIAKSTILPRPPAILDAVPLIIAPHGGFDGFLSRIKFSNRTLNPEQIYKRYREGPRITKSLLDSINDFF